MIAPHPDGVTVRDEKCSTPCEVRNSPASRVARLSQQRKRGYQQQISLDKKSVFIACFFYSKCLAVSKHFTWRSRHTLLCQF